MLIVQGNKEYFDRVGWRCAIEDIIEYFFPTLKGEEITFSFYWKRFDKKVKYVGYHAFDVATLTHKLDVVMNLFDYDNLDYINTILHELRHTEQYKNGDTEPTSRYKGSAYWNHPKEVDARAFAEKHQDEALALVKEYLA